MAGPEKLARRFGAQAETSRRRTPFHSLLSATIAEHPDVVAILAHAPEEQQLPVLLLAAIHDQVLADPGCELASWYPTVCDEPRQDDVTRPLIEHCRAHADDLRHTVATRSTQTNEVGRCGLFLPPLGLLAAEVGRLALGDVGTSAGLNLQLDRLAYDYRPGGPVGGPSPVHLEVATRGAVPVPVQMPVIAHRIGLDRQPIDLSDPREARWLRACVWPDQADRLHRLDAVIGLAVAHPPELRTGDAVDDLADLVDDLGRHGHPVVTNSWVLNYLPPQRRVQYVAALDALGRERDLSWIFCESPAQAEGLPFDPAVRGRHLTALVLVRWRDGERRVEHLGVAHPHGYWLHWHDG